MFQKIKSFVLDKRLPYFLPYNYLRSLKLKKSLTETNVNNIKISLTFDVERLPMNKIENPGKFLEKITKLLNKKGGKGTFFIEGSLVEKFPENIKKMKRNEIGLHGFKHELWGNEKWWNPREPIKYKEKVYLIDRSLKIFENNGFERPISFRAPYLISNSETTRVIQNFGFKIDSSQPSYLGKIPIPSKENNLIEIPVTANPIFRVDKRFFLPFSYYDIFNMETLKKTNKIDFLKFIDNVINFQILKNVQPHLVFLGHSWEFSRIDNKKFSYSSSDNYKVLNSFLKLLEERYNVDYITLKKLSKIFGGLNGSPSN